MATTKASFHWDDPLLLDQQLTDDERAVRDAAAAYCQERLAPRVPTARTAWPRVCSKRFGTKKPTSRSSARWANWACSAPPSPRPTAAPA